MKRFLLWSLTALLAIAVVISVAVTSQLSQRLKPEAVVSFTIPPGSSLYQIAEQLEDRGIINSALLLKGLARWKKLGGQIQAGNYRFDQAATVSEVLNRLVSGDVEKVSLTIPEGFSLQQIIERISSLGYGKQTVLTHLAHDTEFIRSLGLSAPSLEGYLFPETYLFAEGNNERDLLRMLVNQFRAQITPRLTAAAKDRGLTLHQLVTLASIIEKETALVEEMPLISSVFHNRLQRNIPLQTDPTVIYGIKDFDGNITRKHLRTPTPYNTYIIRGLPPGPIASPGLNALQAAARPQKSKYLYFVARGDGSHQFSKTLREHNAAVRKYQLKRSR